MEEFEVIAKMFGKCPGCSVVAFRVKGRPPVEKHICWAVGMAWPVEVERRKEARQDANVHTEEERYWSGEGARQS